MDGAVVAKLVFFFLAFAIFYGRGRKEDGESHGSTTRAIFLLGLYILAVAGGLLLLGVLDHGPEREQRRFALYGLGAAWAGFATLWFVRFLVGVGEVGRVWRPLGGADLAVLGLAGACLLQLSGLRVP